MALFLLVTFGTAWLAALPLWLGQGLADPLFGPLIGLMMFTPTLGVLAVWLARRTPFRAWARQTGLTLGERPRRTVGLLLAAWAAVPLIVYGTLALTAALGLVTLDLGRSLFASVLGASADPHTALIVQLLVSTLLLPILNIVPMLGEEWGWRGWLLPNLVASRGVSGGLVLSGVIWGLWHAPATALGYNYPAIGPWSALLFVGFCVLAGMLFGWLRLRTGSLWPAVIGHAALNPAAALALLLGDAADPPNTVFAGITGLVGWAVLAVIAALVFKLSPVRQAQPVT
ncbi:CPBP family intramembrane glutamic endopeptidase [Nonomuraea sp. NPDC059194]|uniref:CPBP family intramembrane glutamic endopeptidase n=1 Tax=Nonomuraea sp. NPDC059194 TaxID=3346764 RepID=UPI00369B1180